MPPRLELRRLQKSFDEVPAVRDLSLALERGEFVSLLGPSGCGKSTTLAMIAGFESPEAGEILIDAARRATLRGELKQIQRELGQTVLYVTHDQLEAMSMSDRIAIMKDGEILQIAAPDEIYDRPCNRFVAEFIGDPPINIVACDVAQAAGGVVVSTALHAGLELGRRDLAAGRHLLGFRPHDVEIGPAAVPGSAAATVRFVEALGAESVLHVPYADVLIRLA